MRLAAALEAFVSAMAVGLIVVAAVLTLLKVVPGFSGRIARDIFAGTALAVVLYGAYAALRRLPQHAGALALDRYHRLSDRVTNALTFASLPPERRTPMMEIAIDDACKEASGLSPRRARPIGWPRDLAAALGLLGGVLVIGLLEAPRARPLAGAKTIDPVVLSPDDLDLFRGVAKKIGETEKNPEVLAALEQYNQLIEDLAQRRLDRTEAFRRMEEIESRLMQGRAMDAKALDKELEERAKALKSSELSRPLAEALEMKHFAKAEKEARDLAKWMRDKPNTFKKADLEKLRNAMQKASKGQKDRMAALEQRREELRQQLLQQKQRDGGAGTEEEQRLLHKNERELERLDRERDAAEQASRHLDRLDRDLAQAAEDIMRELGLSADDLDKGADDIHRMAEEKMSDEDREELRRRLQDLREQLRQEGQGGAQRTARLRRFMRQALGEGQPGGVQKQKRPCPPGDPNCKPEGNEGEGQGEEEGEGEGQGKELTLGPGQGQGGESVLLLSKGHGQSPGPGQGQGQPGQPGDQPGGKGEHGAGHEHDPNFAGKKGTDPRMPTQDVQAVGADTQRGASRSEVILGAAEKGFKGSGYKRVYTEYRTSAEEQLHQDKVPPGANEHIRRYFDLIRPRE